MKTLRFKRKTYGRGRTPATWQGRLITGSYIALIILWSMGFQNLSQYNLAFKLPYNIIDFDDEGNLLVFLVPMIILTIGLLIICYRKGETPRRQWGDKKQSE